MYDVSKGKVEANFQKLFQLVNSKHNIQTRQATAGHLSQPLVRTNYKQISSQIMEQRYGMKFRKNYEMLRVRKFLLKDIKNGF